MMLSCVRIAPFGRPVVPDVYMIKHGSLASTVVSIGASVALAIVAS